MSDKKGFLIHNVGGGSLNWARFEDQAFKTAEDAYNYTKRLTDSGSWPGRNFRILAVPAEQVEGFLKDIKRTAGATLGPLHVGEWVNKIPGREFLGKKAEFILKVGGVALAAVGASGQAFAATGDFNTAARAGANAGGRELNQTLNPENRFSNGLTNMINGSISAGFAKVAEGASDVMGLGYLPVVGRYVDAGNLERDRVLPAAKNILEESRSRKEGFSKITNEIIKGHENAKYIILADETLPKEYNGKPMWQALKDDKVYRNYEHALQGRIESSNGSQKDMWQGQLEAIHGYRQALNAEQGVAMPRPSQALGLNF